MRFENIATSLENDPEYQKRLEKWEETEKYFSGSGNKDDEDDDEDFYGSDDSFSFYEEESWIDKKIKELVVGLTLFGVKTIFSCEGHSDGVYSEDDYTLKGAWHIPFVAFDLGVDLKYPYGEKDWQEKEKKEQEIIDQIQLLIDEFYRDCEVLPEIRVRLQKIEARHLYDCVITTSELEDQGRESTPGVQDYDEAERIAEEKLEKEQQEILRFSEFLKKKYLETGLIYED
jgi:hypothetical protein